MKIRTKLIAISIVLIFVIFSLSFFLIEYFRSVRLDLVGQNSTVMAEEILKRLNYNIRIIIEDIKLYSIDSDFNRLLENYASAEKYEPTEMVKKLQERFFEVWMENRGYRLFSSVDIISTGGIIISSTDASLINMPADISKIPEPDLEKGFFIDEIYFDTKSNNYILPISVIISDNDGSVKCIVRVELLTLSFLQELEIGYNLYDLSKIIIICETPKVLIFRSGSYQMLSDISGYDFYKHLDSDTGYFSLAEAGQNYQYAYVKSSENRKWTPNWTVLIRNNEREIMTQFNSVKAKIYSFVIILSVFLLVLKILIIKNITLSVNNLQNGARIIGEGNLDFRIKSVSRDEIDTVVTEFNNMSTNLVKVVTRKEGLEKEIRKRKKAETELKNTMVNLERSNRELEQFAYVASHDLQEPLRMVASYTQLLAKRYQGKLDQDANDFIGFAVEGAVRMQSLINSLLEYSRVATKGSPFKTVDCNKLLGDVLKFMEYTISENKAEISADNLASVFGDEIQLFRVFQNLIQNAIKFKKHDEAPRIHISSKKTKNSCIFSVSDNGISISSEYFDIIFVIFKRLHSREDYQGSGMGLSITKRIIERHDGTIWLESEPGRGTVFYFTLPANKEKKNDKDS